MATGIYRHYTADGRVVGEYPGTGDIDPVHMLPAALRLAIKPGDTVEYIARDEARPRVVVTTWDVITELVERPGRGMGKGGQDG